MSEQEYIIMASGEIITWERIEAWAAAAKPPKDAQVVESELLECGEIKRAEDFFQAQSDED